MDIKGQSRFFIPEGMDWREALAEGAKILVERESGEKVIKVERLSNSHCRTETESYIISVFVRRNPINIGKATIFHTEKKGGGE